MVDQKSLTSTDLPEVLGNNMQGAVEALDWMTEYLKSFERRRYAVDSETLLAAIKIRNRYDDAIKRLTEAIGEE